MKCRCTIIFDVRRATTFPPPGPHRLFLRASTTGRHQPPPGKVNNVYHGLAFHRITRCPLSYFSAAKSCHFLRAGRKSWPTNLFKQIYAGRHKSKKINAFTSRHRRECLLLYARADPASCLGGGQLVGPHQTLPIPKLVFFSDFAHFI